MFQHLLREIAKLETDKETIVKRWMAHSDVKRTLKRHQIGVDFFAQKFGLRVLNYAIGVIKGENVLGQCPVITVMLMLFKNKNIPLADVFMICVNLKNALMHYYQEQPEHLSHSLIDEIALLMDTNFQGVINEYVALYYNDELCSSTYCAILPEDVLLQSPKTQRDSLSSAFFKTLTSAKEYLIDTSIDRDAIEELDELEHDALSAIELQRTEETSFIHEIIALFNKYAKILNMLVEFQSLSYALFTLGDLLKKTPFDALELDEQTMVKEYLRAIINDLQSWRISIFITHEAEDIHYLDKTLLSSISQLEIILMPDDEFGISDEIEFF